MKVRVKKRGFSNEKEQKLISFLRIVVDSSFYLNKTYIGVLTLLSVLIGYRKFGGFYYRCTMVVLSLFTMATYGFFAAIVLGIVGRTDLVNWSVARGFYYLGGFFWDVTVKPEGLENLNKVKGPVIYVCNHQSSMDILLMGKVYPKNTAIVAKKAIKYYPFMGWFSKYISTLIMIILLILK